MNNKVELRLLFQDLSSFSFNSDYTFLTLSTDTVDQYRDAVEKVIQYHHEDLVWDGIPSFDIVKQRLEFGSKCHLWLYKGEPLGWHWTNSQCISEDWLTCLHTIKKNEIYIGGAFLSRKNKPSASSSLYFYRQGFEYSLVTEKKDTMYLYSDDWNRASAQLCYRCGFKKYNFLK